MPSITRKPWPPFAQRLNRNGQASSPVGSICSTTMHGLIRPTQSRHYRNSSGRFSVTLHTVQTSLPEITSFLIHYNRLWRSNDSPRTTPCSTCRTGWQRSPEILWDTYSPPCVAVGQVPQQPGPILLTYKYWFLFLGLRLVYFLMPLIQIYYFPLSCERKGFWIISCNAKFISTYIIYAISFLLTNIILTCFLLTVTVLNFTVSLQLSNIGRKYQYVCVL